MPADFEIGCPVWAYSAQLGPIIGEVSEVRLEVGRVVFVRVLSERGNDVYSQYNVYKRPEQREKLIIRIMNDYDHLAECAHAIADSCKKCGLPPGCPDCKGVHDVGAEE